jgi:hypothetical protein
MLQLSLHPFRLLHDIGFLISNISSGIKMTPWHELIATPQVHITTSIQGWMS